MRYLLVALVLSISTLSKGQDLIDVSGEWNGNSNFLNVNFVVTTVINQKGSQLDGYSISKSVTGKDSSRLIFTGIVDATTVKLFPVRFEYKTGTACLANSVLQFSEQDRQYALVGRWQGDLSLKTCPIAAGGNVSLYRGKTVVPQVIVSEEPQPRSVHESDAVGNALISELGKRRY